VVVLGEIVAVEDRWVGVVEESESGLEFAQIVAVFEDRLIVVAGVEQQIVVELCK